MATRKEKEQLMEILKFKPTTVRIMIQGYGGECYIGSVGREQYEFFKSKKIDIDQYTHSWDENGMWDDVPSDMRPFDPGSPYDCDDLFHQSGATMDDSSRITVTYDETGEDIFETNLDISNLEDQGIVVDCGDDFDSSDLKPGSVIFWGGQGEKGCFFDGTFTLRAPFDPAKLRIRYGNGDDWYICSGVEYDGEDIEGQDGYSTTGKWGEAKFWIAGDEEVYEGVERNEDGDSDDDVEVLDGEEMQAQEAIDAESDRSPWHPADVNPEIKGEYEVFEKDSSWPFPQRAEWTGRGWKQNGEKITIREWRGLNYDPYENT